MQSSFPVRALSSSYANRPVTQASEVSDLNACQYQIRAGSKSFFAASLLLPANVRKAATALYAFCRIADDSVDLQVNPAQALKEMQGRLDRIYAGRPDAQPIDRAFEKVVEQYGIPRDLPEALFEGFLWDVQSRRYESLSDLYSYCARVAGSVGAMMSLLMGVRDPALVARACDLGVAMQLTNIARDVGEDAREGRLYLPRDWMREAGIDPDAWMAKPVFDAAVSSVIARVLSTADDLYIRANSGIANLPFACRPGVFAARFIYAEIGQSLKQRRCDSISQRTVVPTARKLLLLLTALGASTIPAKPSLEPALPETQFLVTTTSRAIRPMDRPPQVVQTAVPWWQINARVCWIIDLFERLEKRDKMTRVSSRI